MAVMKVMKVMKVMPKPITGITSITFITPDGTSLSSPPTGLITPGPNAGPARLDALAGAQ